MPIDEVELEELKDGVAELARVGIAQALKTVDELNHILRQLPNASRTGTQLLALRTNRLVGR